MTLTSTESDEITSLRNQLNEARLAEATARAEVKSLRAELEKLETDVDIATASNAYFAKRLARLDVALADISDVIAKELL